MFQPRRSIAQRSRIARTISARDALRRLGCSAASRAGCINTAGSRFDGTGDCCTHALECCAAAAAAAAAMCIALISGSGQELVELLRCAKQRLAQLLCVEARFGCDERQGGDAARMAV